MTSPIERENEDNGIFGFGMKRFQRPYLIYEKPKTNLELPKDIKI